MSDDADLKASILPYSLIVGQEELRRALEISYVSDAVGGVLATGQRGTAKTTTVRAFTMMLTGELPVTLPIGATDDRVLGGWKIDKLMQGEPVPQKGLLVEAAKSKAGILYIDEINLLDDYLVNIILDVVSTGILTVQRDNLDEQALPVSFTLVGTMNPDEGPLRPQLLDRFGLVAEARRENDVASRARVMEAVLTFHDDPGSELVTRARERDQARRTTLEEARKRVGEITFGDGTLEACARLGHLFKLAGHRGELVLARAARAHAAIEGEDAVTLDHVKTVAPLALRHRRSVDDSGKIVDWDADRDDTLVDQALRGE
jgi:magnesium chelatase subunit I